MFPYALVGEKGEHGSDASVGNGRDVNPACHSWTADRSECPRKCCPRVGQNVERPVTISPPSAADLNNGSVPADLRGTVGSFKVSGVFFPPTGNGQRQTSPATFTVTKQPGSRDSKSDLVTASGS
jgi:hypothetical protein